MGEYCRSAGVQPCRLAGWPDCFFPRCGCIHTHLQDIQAADDGLPNNPGSPPHLSDSDRSTSDPDPESVSVPVVVLEKVVVGEEVRINEDGVLTPNDDTLDEWLAADDTLRIFVVLQGGKSGIFTPSAGVVHEHLSVASSHGVASSKIAVSWDADDWRLSLTGTGNATRLDFQKVLGTLQLQTVPFGQVSHRTISVQPDTSDMSVPVARAGYYLRGVEVSASAPNPILELDFDKSHMDSGQRFVFTEEHISVYDPDTHDADGNVDPSKISFRITGLAGGELQRRSSSSASDWSKIVAGGKAYLEFTLADLKAGKIAFLAGDGLASGEGTKVVFQVQAADAADNNANLSDSDPQTPDKDPVGAEILVGITAKVTAGFRGLINADGVLSPDEATLGVWKQSATTHSGTLHVIVRLGDMQDGDILSLRTGYDATKIKTADWDATKKELSIEFDNAATPSEMKTVLGFLEFESALSDSASTRKVWVFPTLSGVGSLRYRLDASAGLVRYYFYDSTSRTFSAASTAASGRSFFGKSGYLGVYTSDTEKSIYTGFNQNNIFLAITDSATEGKWLVTAGPRKGQLFWDNTNNQFGPGAAGSGWNAKGDFWWSGEPNNGGSGEDHVELDSNGRVYDVRGNRRSVSHHDFWLSRGGILARLVEVEESPPNPVLQVDFSKLQATARRPSILTEDHISVEDPDTLLSDGRIDPDKITFRVMGMTDGTLQLRPARDSDTWTRIDPSGTAGNQYWEFTLPQLREGLVAFSPNAGISTLTFRIQAADDGPHLSDADPYDGENDADPTSVSIRVVALKEIEAGQKEALNDDNPRGALTPDADTLQAWLTAGTPLRIFVELQRGKSGIVVLEEGAVDESLSLSGSVPNIAATWDGDILSLLGNPSATVADFEAALGALQLQTVRLKEDSYRTISVRPDITGDVPKKDFYVREVKIGASPKEPLLSVRGFERISITAERYLVLDESHILVDDVDTRDSVDSTKVDANKIELRITNIPDSTLQKRASVLDSWIAMTKETSQDYYAFTLTELREGLVSLLPDASVPTLTFEIQAGDGTHFSDSDRNDNQNDADPASVSIRVVALKKIDAGKEMPVSDESGDGALTPSGATLGTWIGAATSSRLRVLVTLHNGRFGEELFLQDGHGIGTITSSWSWDADTSTATLSLQSNGSATTDDFQAVLNALALRTVRSASASVRTISVRPDTASFRPDIAAEVPQQDYYTRDVLVRGSDPRPYVGVQKMSYLKFGPDERATLLSSEFFVEDFDTSASGITIVMRNLTPEATLQKKNDGGSYHSIARESDGSYAFKLDALQKGLIAMYWSNPVGRTITFDLEARDSDGHWNDVSRSHTRQRGVRSFSLTSVLLLPPEKLEVDPQTGYQKVFPFSSVEKMIETARSDGNRDGSLHIVLEHAVSGDRLVMRESVSGITGAWSDGGHRYILTVSDGATTSARIDQALAQIYYRASESAGEKERELVVRWVDSASTETLLLRIPLANRPPVLRQWGIAARYHDITPARGALETPLDLGYHPYREYMPEVLDNEGEVVRLEVVLGNKAGGMLSPDERVFLSQEFLGQLQVQGIVLRDLRSSDKKARALVLESADGKTPISPEFMSRILQGLLYRHGAAARDVDVGERREISVAVFDGEAYSQTRTMEVRLVDETPNPAGYVNTFIGTAKQVGMGVSQGTGNPDNEAGMTFPGAAYPFGAVRLTPDTMQKHAYGGYRHDKSLSGIQFVVTAFSGPGCVASEGGDFSVGIDNTQTKNADKGYLLLLGDADKGSQVSEAGYYKVLLRGGSDEVVLEAAASSPRTATMRLTYQSNGPTGFLSLPGSVGLSEKADHWIVTYKTWEDGVCQINYSEFYVAMHIGKHQVSGVSKSGSRISFALRSGQRAVDIKISMSYTSRWSASRNIDVENPGWNDFEVEKDKARKAWNYYLSKVAIDEFQDDEHDKTDPWDKWSIFYSALYRSMLHMNTASDVDGNYRGIGGSWRNLRDAPSYGYGSDVGTEGPPPKVYFYNFSGWDVYRSQMALVGLMAPALSQDMAISLLESGYVNGTEGHKDQGIVDREIPRWTTGYVETGVMVGDSGPPSVSSLFMFGSRSVSLTSMLEVLYLSSRHARSSSGAGHHILEGVASDTAIAQMALWMSQQDSLPQAVREKARSLYAYARGRTDRALNLLDSQGYAKPSLWEGAASDKSKHYGSLAEGNAIQYTFMIAHDVLGLKEKIDAGEISNTALRRGLIAGPRGGSVQAYNDLLALSKKEGLDRWDDGERSMALRFLAHFLKPNEGKDSWYAFMGNEVAHSSPFLANWFEPHLTQNAVRRISLFGFRNTPGGLFGNDDLGATSAWYIWTAMGIYPVIPGVGGVTVVPPSFEHVEISVPGGKSVQLRSSSGRAEDAYIQSVRRDGRETSSLWLTSSELLRGVKLDFRVGSSKSGWGEDASDSPPSYGDNEKGTPDGYGSIWREEGDDATGASSHSAFDGSRNTAWRFISEPDGSKVLEVDFTSVYAASGLLLRHADVGRTSTLNSDLGNVTVSVAVKDVDGNWN